MAVPRRIRRKQAPSADRIAQAIFAALETRGIADRELGEGLVREVLARLEGARPLPGMEGLVAPGLPRPRHESLEEVLEEILAAKEPAPAPVPAPPPAAPFESPLTPNALTVLERRYLKRDETGKVLETPQDMLRRVAQNVAAVDTRYNPRADLKATTEEFYRAMASLDFLPNSPTLMNAGRELQQLSACFVLPIEDSMESIFDAVKYTALIHKSGGGTGFSFSRLRPGGDIVGSSSGVASGPVSFMRAFDTATDVTKQGGTRRGANMAILNVDHPDILKFIKAKEIEGHLSNFNISVAVTERFMQAVERGEDYDLINPRTKKPQGRLKAKEVFDLMVEMAWKGGDPGIVFIDRINRDNPTPHLGHIESTNPCGEQPLLPYESCNLGSLNLARMLRRQDSAYEIDWRKLEGVIKTAVHFLDNVIDANKYPLPKIEEMTRATRKVGLGVMGFADMLILLGLPYDSEEALAVGEKVMAFIQDQADAASAELARMRGAFPAFKGSAYDQPGAAPLRNSTRTTIAPTGTLSIIAGVSSGIEPLFALAYTRHILDDDKLAEVHPIFEEMAQEQGFYSEALMKSLARRGSVRGLAGIPEAMQRLFPTAHDIDPTWHVRMQAAFQRHTDNAVSKTINFPHQATVAEVARAYMLAYQEGCKGITIFRDRSRTQQVLNTEHDQAPALPAVEALGPAATAAPPAAGAPKGGQKITPRRRPAATLGATQKVATGCGNLYITVNSDGQGICEVFSHLGKAGGCAQATSEATSRLISLALRSGVDPAAVVEQLRGIRCPSIAWDDGKAVLSCPDAISAVLARHLDGATAPAGPALAAEAAPPALAGGDLAGNPLEAVVNLAGQCPDCSSLLVYGEGCLHCRACGYTKCG
ncbi:MAG: vitamin B12-dependent ribonucleotide reductase [Chloroflexi bacterium]|nr:vitamin B12-dependent ribonucleotide reductase [Chloroflexota bacterium]